MSDWDIQRERAEQWADEDLCMMDEEGSSVIGRITQLTDRVSVPVKHVDPLGIRSWYPSDRLVPVQPLYMVYVFRQNGQAGMVVNRISPFQSEQMYLTDLEMQVVMNWAARMSANDIGRFTPIDGGWMWWRK